MYELWGGGSPFTVKDGDLIDSAGTRVRLLGSVRKILYELRNQERWRDTCVAVASCTDEPGWADECLSKFAIGGGECIKDVVQEEDIYKANKRKHLTRLSERTNIQLEDMIFFDNERGNCFDVASIGVTVACVPHGVTAEAWERALEKFPAPGEVLGDGF